MHRLMLTLLALLLVLGMGVDYAIFFAEARHDRATVLFALLLSAGTTVLAFGLLGASGTPALRAIGQVVLPGIAFSLLLAPIASRRDSRAPLAAEGPTT